MPQSHARLVLGFMSAAIVLGAFAPVVPPEIAGYLKGAVVAATGLAGLFLHPPLPLTPSAPVAIPPAGDEAKPATPAS